MASPPGNYNLQNAMNNASPVNRRARMGDKMAAIIAAINGLALQADTNTAIANGTVVNASGTITVGGSITNGNTYTISFVNPGIPSLVSPGVILAGSVVTGDTLATAAAKIVTLISGNATLAAAGINANSAAAVVTVKQAGTIGNTTVIVATPTGTLTLTVVALSGGNFAVVPRAATAYTIAPLNTIP